VAEETEKIRLPCPLCEREHEYSITITRSIIIARLSRDADLRPRKRAFVRAFTCLENGERFQAKLTFTETILSPIEAVAVSEAGSQ
jgi:hypothetical protein